MTRHVSTHHQTRSTHSRTSAPPKAPSHSNNAALNRLGASSQAEAAQAPGGHTYHPQAPGGHTYHPQSQGGRSAPAPDHDLGQGEGTSESAGMLRQMGQWSASDTPKAAPKASEKGSGKGSPQAAPESRSASRPLDELSDFHEPVGGPQVIDASRMAEGSPQDRVSPQDIQQNRETVSRVFREHGLPGEVGTAMGEASSGLRNQASNGKTSGIFQNRPEDVQYLASRGLVKGLEGKDVGRLLQNPEFASHVAADMIQTRMAGTDLPRQMNLQEAVGSHKAGSAWMQGRTDEAKAGSAQAKHDYIRQVDGNLGGASSHHGRSDDRVAGSSPPAASSAAGPDSKPNPKRDEATVAANRWWEPQPAQQPQAASTKPASEAQSTKQVQAPSKPASEAQSAARSQGGDLGKLPPLGNNPSTPELKKWVSQVYDQFPQFKDTYENKLGMTRDQALAFHYADMSRESGKDGKWQMDLETGQGGPGHAWGPFQAAVTNFKGGGYDRDILSNSGLPTPDISQFKDPQVSTFAGMKRLLEGTQLATQELGSGRPAQDYLLGSVAHHNTGHIRDTVANADWQKSYGQEILRLQQGYLNGHMSDDKAYWTGEPL